MTKRKIKITHYFSKLHVTIAACLTLILTGSLLVEHAHEINSPLKSYIARSTDSSSLKSKRTEYQQSLFTTPLRQTEKTVTVLRGDTLSALFTREGISHQSLKQLLTNKKAAQALSHLDIGQKLKLELNIHGDIQTLESQTDKLKIIQIKKKNEAFVFSQKILAPKNEVAYAHGIIKNSLASTIKQAKLPHSILTNLVKIFSNDINFATDLRSGDEFEILYERKMIDKKEVDLGHILYVRIKNKNKLHSAIRYTNKTGKTAYYTAEGKNRQKSFMQNAPVDFTRISSRFSYGRRHPVLHTIRAHKGVDYAAPRGTPIKSIGDGLVITAEYKRGYGYTVIIQHNKKYRTLYAHMSKFSKGIKSGSRVAQGQVIGYIGTSGLSTGPHLHYEFLVNGKHVDPLNESLPTNNPLSLSEKKEFLKMRQLLFTQMKNRRNSMFAFNKIELK